MLFLDQTITTTDSGSGEERIRSRIRGEPRNAVAQVVHAWQRVAITRREECLAFGETLVQRMKTHFLDEDEIRRGRSDVLIRNSMGPPDRKGVFIVEIFEGGPRSAGGGKEDRGEWVAVETRRSGPTGWEITRKNFIMFAV